MPPSLMVIMARVLVSEETNIRQSHFLKTNHPLRCFSLKEIGIRVAAVRIIKITITTPAATPIIVIVIVVTV